MDSLTRDVERTNHTEAFGTAFDLYSQFFGAYFKDARLREVYPTIIYVSRGLLSEITEAKQVLTTIMNGIHRVDRAVDGRIRPGRSALANPIQINTVALMEPGKLVMWETQFLQDVASQNFSKHKLAAPGDHHHDETNEEEISKQEWSGKILSTPGKVRNLLFIREILTFLSFNRC